MAIKTRPGVTLTEQDAFDREAMQAHRSRGGKRKAALRAVEAEIMRRARLKAKEAQTQPTKSGI
jgi:hypothetical protein